MTCRRFVIVEQVQRSFRDGIGSRSSLLALRERHGVVLQDQLSFPLQILDLLIEELLVFLESLLLCEELQ